MAKHNDMATFKLKTKTDNKRIAPYNVDHVIGQQNLKINDHNVVNYIDSINKQTFLLI